MRDEDMLKETYRLAQENNKMLRRMRRAALLGTLTRLIFWIAMLLIAWWFYVNFIGPVVDSMIATYEQIQGTSAQAQAQFGDLTARLRELQQMFGGGQN